MPRDLIEFPEITIPAVETDAVLRRLTEGRARIAAGWCVNRLSITVGERTHYCARGACMPTGDWGSYDSTTRECERLLARALPRRLGVLDAEAVARFNNTGRQADVLALFDRAIAARRAEIGA